MTANNNRRNPRVNLDRLEAREVMSGNVQAFVSGGDLYIGGTTWTTTSTSARSTPIPFALGL